MDMLARRLHGARDDWQDVAEQLMKTKDGWLVAPVISNQAMLAGALAMFAEHLSDSQSDELTKEEG